MCFVIILSDIREFPQRAPFMFHDVSDGHYNVGFLCSARSCCPALTLKSMQ